MEVEGTAAPAAESEAAAVALEGGDDVEGPYTRVFSSSLIWEAQGTQEERFPRPAAPVHADILVAKLAPGQRIELECHAVKGVGRDHAKFSPVATATYRLLPSITLSTAKPFVDDEADALVAKCPVGVFDIEDIAGEWGRRGGEGPRHTHTLSA
jgi:DNA-directed RNA polymerase I and III subunit RPAC1